MIKKMLLLFIICSVKDVSAQYGKDAMFWIYGGPNIGAFRYNQGPLDYRAWEFNNYVGVSKQMKANKSFAGYKIGAILNLSSKKESGLGFPMGIEISHISNSMSGQRDSSGVIIHQQYKQQINGFYFGIGLSILNNDDRTGFMKNITIGYIPFFSLTKVKIKDNTTIGSTSIEKKAIFEGRVITVKNVLYINYRINKNYMVALHPYLENHIFDGSADLVYNDASTHAFIKEVYNLKNFGTTLCFNYTF